MSVKKSPPRKDCLQITPEMLQAGYAVISEFDPDITCLTSAEAVNTMLKAVYIAMIEVRLGANIEPAIQAGLAHLRS
ncbi:MAG: hypothetical protein ACLP7P_05765 [Rhodomicrobium sp.]